MATTVGPTPRHADNLHESVDIVAIPCIREGLQNLRGDLSDHIRHSFLLIFGTVASRKRITKFVKRLPHRGWGRVLRPWRIYGVFD